MLFRRLWVVGWIIMVSLSLISLWDISWQTCGAHTPILLSRALTSEPYRGFLLSFCVVAFVSSFFLQSIILIAGFLGFLCAFLVSMFTTPTTHDALIIMSSVCVMYECWPAQTEGRSENTLLWWKAHWLFTFVAAIVCTTWMLSASQVCDTVQCERCSWWFISEYMFFWSMYILVYWRVPINLEWSDKVKYNSINVVMSKTTTFDPTKQLETGARIASELDF